MKNFKRELENLKSIIKDDFDLKLADLVLKSEESKRQSRGWITTVLSVTVPAFVLIISLFIQHLNNLSEKREEFESAVLMKMLDTGDRTTAINNFQYARQLGLIRNKEVLNRVDFLIQDSLNQKAIFEFRKLEGDGGSSLNLSDLGIKATTFNGVTNGVNFSIVNSSEMAKLLSLPENSSIKISGLVFDSARVYSSPFITADSALRLFRSSAISPN